MDSLWNEDDERQLCRFKQTAGQNRTEHDGKSVAAADIHNGMVVFSTTAHAYAASAACAVCGVWVGVLFWQKTQEFHSSAHPGKYLELSLMLAGEEELLRLRQHREHHAQAMPVVGLPPGQYWQ